MDLKLISKSKERNYYEYCKPYDFEIEFCVEETSTPFYDYHDIVRYMTVKTSTKSQIYSDCIEIINSIEENTLFFEFENTGGVTVIVKGGLVQQVLNPEGVDGTMFVFSLDIVSSKYHIYNEGELYE